MNRQLTWIAALAMATGLHVAPVVGPLPAIAQAQPDTTQTSSTLGELRDRIETNFRVLPVQNGIVLIPTRGASEVQSIELVGETIAVDGEPVTGAELRDRVGEPADDIVRLSFLDSTDRRILFGLGEPPAPAVEDVPADSIKDVPADSLEDAAEADEAGAEAALEEDDDEEDVVVDGVDVGSEGDRVRIGGSVRVHADEVIHGDVVAVGGSVRVDGRVTGDVVAVAGSVRLGPDAQIDGDVVAAGGTVHRAAGARIGGEIEEVDFGFPRWSGRPDFYMGSVFEGIGGVVSTTAMIVFLMLLAALVYLVARGPVDRMERKILEGPWKAALVGLASQLLFLPALVLITLLLAISIIGIPLLIAIPFALLALVIGTLAGFTAAAKALGQGAESRFGWAHANPYVSVFVGVGLIMAASFFGSVLGLGGGPLNAFAIALGILGFLIQYAAWTVGFGVLILRLFEYRRESREPTYETPPEPEKVVPPAGRTPSDTTSSPDEGS